MVPDMSSLMMERSAQFFVGHALDRSGRHVGDWTPRAGNEAFAERHRQLARLYSDGLRRPREPWLWRN